MKEERARKVYFAGSLFDLRHLLGNASLAREVERQSEGRYTVYLPQNYEPASLDAKTIRDSDFEGLLGCDAAVFQFDGCELDSGTVAEFMAAKFADIPSLLLRTDFRRAGDRNEEPWNLMCSFYPRTESLVVDALELYVECGGKNGDGVAAATAAMHALAPLVIEKLDTVSRFPAVDTSGTTSDVDRLKRLLGLGGGQRRSEV